MCAAGVRILTFHHIESNMKRNLLLWLALVMGVTVWELAFPLYIGFEFELSVLTAVGLYLHCDKIILFYLR